MKLALQTIDICHGYADGMAKYDEMCAIEGSVRPHWQYLLDALKKLGSNDLRQRNQETQRQLQQTGVTFDIHHDIHTQSRPLQLDPIPFVIESQEWSRIEAGLIQRAELLEYILKDIYGSKELIKNGLLPPELVFAHQGFLRACDCINTVHAHRLLNYAADLARSEDGRIWVLADRTQTPTGAGYALENRMVMRRVFPSLFRDSHVHRLAGFFRSLRNELSEISPRKKSSRIVLLTRGLQDDSYFEHSYLANYLGYTLVQGSDLTARMGKIWLKSLDGLKQIDVILRRVDDHLCDPLEFQQDSRHGVPGLLEAVREGNVAIANPFGSSILENPALQAFLPGICRHLFGQELLLPGIASWWCGQKNALDYVMNNFDQLIIKPIAKQQQVKSFVPEELNPQERELMRQKIIEKPHLYVAQERIKYATTPTLIDGRFQARPTIQRTFLTAAKNTFIVMPGGLSQVVSSDSNWQTSTESALITKDIWVLASEPERLDTLWNNIQSIDDYSGIGSLPSRAAENFYWLGRMVERAESFIRLFRTIMLKVDEIAEYQNSIDKYCLITMLQAVTQLTGLPTKKLFNEALPLHSKIDSEMLNMLLDQHNAGSLYSTIGSMVNSAYSVRDLLTPDTWRVFSKFEDILDNWQKNPPNALSETADELDELISTLAAFSGLILESTTVDQGWLFLNVGRRLERSVGLTVLIQAILLEDHSESIEYTLLQSLLTSTDSMMTYHRRHRTNLQIHSVLELLLLDQTSPRSLRYQFEHLQQAIKNLPNADSDMEISSEQRYILEASTLLLLSDVQNLCIVNSDTLERSNLKQLLSRINQLMQSTSKVITDSYFNHIMDTQQLL